MMASHGGVPQDVPWPYSEELRLRELIPKAEAMCE